MTLKERLKIYGFSEKEMEKIREALQYSSYDEIIDFIAE